MLLFEKLAAYRNIAGPWLFILILGWHYRALSGKLMPVFFMRTFFYRTWRRTFNTAIYINFRNFSKLLKSSLIFIYFIYIKMAVQLITSEIINWFLLNFVVRTKKFQLFKHFSIFLCNIFMSHFTILDMMIMWFLKYFISLIQKLSI